MEWDTRKLHISSMFVYKGIWYPFIISTDWVGYQWYYLLKTQSSGRSRGAPPAGKFFSILCSFREHLIKFILAPPSPRVGTPPCENPGSATAESQRSKNVNITFEHLWWGFKVISGPLPWVNIHKWTLHTIFIAFDCRKYEHIDKILIGKKLEWQI